MVFDTNHGLKILEEILREVLVFSSNDQASDSLTERTIF